MASLVFEFLPQKRHSRKNSYVYFPKFLGGLNKIVFGILQKF